RPNTAKPPSGSVPLARLWAVAASPGRAGKRPVAITMAAAASAHATNAGATAPTPRKIAAVIRGNEGDMVAMAPVTVEGPGRPMSTRTQASPAGVGTAMVRRPPIAVAGQ